MKKKYYLKNRRRFYAMLSLILIIAVLGIFVSSANCYKEPAYTTIVIKSGDTLWSIAEKYNKKMDIRKYIYEIKKLNNLKSGEIYVGDLLILPTY